MYYKNKKYNQNIKISTTEYDIEKIYEDNYNFKKISKTDIEQMKMHGFTKEHSA